MAALVLAALHRRSRLRGELGDGSLDLGEPRLDRRKLGGNLLLRKLIRVGRFSDHIRAGGCSPGKVGHLVFIGHRFTSVWLCEGSGSFAAIPTRILGRFDRANALLTQGESA